MKVIPNATKVKVSPKMAAQMIEAHEKLAQARGGEELNRNINDNLVNKYAADMLAGKWHLNGETVKVADSSRILDGQHRLWAAVNHDVSFETMMVTGLDEQSFYTIDIGRSRRPSDFLTVDGVTYGPIVAASARLIIGYRKKDLKNMHMQNTPDIVEFAKNNPRISGSAALVHNMNRIVATSCACAWHFLFSEQSQEGADKFIGDLRDGVGLSKGDPVLVLRERLIKNKASKAKLTSRDIFILGLRAWNDRRAGKQRKVVRVVEESVSTALPKIA